MDQQHGLHGIVLPHHLAADVVVVSAPEVVARAHALLCCAGGFWRANRLFSRFFNSKYVGGLEEGEDVDQRNRDG